MGAFGRWQFPIHPSIHPSVHSFTSPSFDLRFLPVSGHRSLQHAMWIYHGVLLCTLPDQPSRRTVRRPHFSTTWWFPFDGKCCHVTSFPTWVRGRLQLGGPELLGWCGAHARASFPPRGPPSIPGASERYNRWRNRYFRSRPSREGYDEERDTSRHSYTNVNGQRPRIAPTGSFFHRSQRIESFVLRSYEYTANPLRAMRCLFRGESATHTAVAWSFRRSPSQHPSPHKSGLRPGPCVLPLLFHRDLPQDIDARGARYDPPVGRSEKRGEFRFRWN